MQDSPPGDPLLPGQEVVHKPGCPGSAGLGGGLAVGYERCPACGSARRQAVPKPQVSDAPAASVRQAEAGLGLAAFEQSSDGMMTMFRFGDVGEAAEASQMAKSKSAVDGMECTLDKDELRRLQQERGLRPPPGAPQRPTVKRKPRVPAMDRIAARDAFGVVAGVLLDVVSTSGAAFNARSAAALRRKAIDVWQRTSAGGTEDTTLQAITQAVNDGLPAILALKGDGSAISTAVYRCTDRGDRGYMEDFASCAAESLRPRVLFNDPKAAGDESALDTFAAVFDGHTGVDAAEWGRTRLAHLIFAHPSYDSSTERTLKDACAKLDSDFAEFAESESCDSGACMLVALHRASKRELWTAGAGDCLGFLCRSAGDDDFETVPLSTPHHLLQNKAEEQAVLARGGNLLFGGGRLRVEGALQITRSIGDRPFRASLSQEAEVVCTPLVDGDEFAVIGSDGLFEEMKPTDVLEFVRQSKMALDEWYEQQRKLLRMWEKAGCPLRKPSPSAKSASHRASRQVSVDSMQCNSRTASTLKPGGMPPRRWSVWAAEDEQDDVQLPPLLQAVYDTLHKLVDQQQELCEGMSELEDDAQPSPAALDELLNKAFHKETEPCDTYQIVVDALVAEAFTQKQAGRDNTSAVVIFFNPMCLCSSDLELARQIRRGA